MPEGFPVVLSDTGTPFVAVTGGAPLATVSTNGLGTPIRVVSANAPSLIVEGYNREQLMAFTLDAGSGNGGDIGYYRTIYGNAYPEPLHQDPLIEFASRNSGYFQVAFMGNVLSSVAGWYPVIGDGTFNIGTIDIPWAYNADEDYTSATWTGGDTLTENTEYSITWSNAV